MNHASWGIKTRLTPHSRDGPRVLGSDLVSYFDTRRSVTDPASGYDIASRLSKDASLFC
jgi:hypothetical protein